MKSYGSRFCRQCGRLFQLAEPDSQTCGACGQPPVQAQCAPAQVTPAAASSAPPAPGKPHRDARKRAPRPRRAGAGRNSGPESGQRTLPMLRALTNAPGGLTTPQLAVHASAGTSWVNALGSARQLMLKQERLGRVRLAGTVPGERTRTVNLWRITAEGEQYVRDAACPAPEEERL